MTFPSTCLARAMVAILLLALSACVTKFPADPDRLAARGQPIESLAAIEWPTLVGHEPPLPIADQLGLSNVILVAHGLNGSSLSRYAFATKAEINAWNRDEHGLLMALTAHRSDQWTVEADQRQPSNFRRLLYSLYGPTLREAMKDVQAGKPNPITLSRDEEYWGDLPADGVLFDLREPPLSATDDGTPRGLIIWYHSLGGLSFEEMCLAELQRRGWLIAVAAFPWGMNADLELPITDETLEESGRIAARSVDRRLAAAAYGAQAVRNYVYTCAPALQDRPVVVWGASAGSFAAPAVAARLGDVSAVILIGSGANLLAVSQGSTFFDGGIKLTYPTQETALDEDARRKELRQGLMKEYAKATVLDPLITAPRLRTTPVLMLHGRTDEIVPAAQGDELWELLGKPERWVFSAGHQALFWRLSSQSMGIADWLDSAVPKGTTTLPSVQPAGP